MVHRDERVACQEVLEEGYVQPAKQWEPPRRNGGLWISVDLRQVGLDVEKEVILGETWE